MPVWEDEPDAVVITDSKQQLKKPPLYKVLLHNDDYTTMEFVVWVLQMVFQKDQDEAMALMLAVHQTGRGVAGVYTKDIADTKCDQVMELAEANAMPLLCTTEPD